MSIIHPTGSIGDVSFILSIPRDGTLLTCLSAFFRSRYDLGIEILALRQQLGIRERKNPRPWLRIQLSHSLFQGSQSRLYMAPDWFVGSAEYQSLISDPLTASGFPLLSGWSEHIRKKIK